MVFIYNICICIGKYEIENRLMCSSLPDVACDARNYGKKSQKTPSNILSTVTEGLYYVTSCNSCGQKNEKEDELTRFSPDNSKVWLIVVFSPTVFFLRSNVVDPARNENVRGW
jgi:hypothetical protein